MPLSKPANQPTPRRCAVHGTPSFVTPSFFRSYRSAERRAWFGNGDISGTHLARVRARAPRLVSAHPGSHVLRTCVGCVCSKRRAASFGVSFRRGTLCVHAGLSGGRTSTDWGTVGRHRCMGRGERRASCRRRQRLAKRATDTLGCRRARALSRELNMAARDLKVPVLAHAAVATRRVWNASFRRVRSMGREVRWRWALNVFGQRREWRENAGLIPAI